MKILRVAVLSALLFMAYSCPVLSGDCSFTFDVPTIPQSPKLYNISNSTAYLGAEYFTVSAIIEGVEQMNACCGPNCDRSDCEMEDWYMRPSPDVYPNPTCIPNAGGHPDFVCYDDVCEKPGNPKVY